MPNHIKNRIEITGTKEQKRNFFKKFNTYYKAKLHRAYDGSIICTKKDGGIGWFCEKTGVFKQREKEDVIGIPEGFNMEIEDAFDHFSDFEKVIPQPKNIFKGNLSREDEIKCVAEGIPTWYEWNKQNWGTKWNSYFCEKKDDNIFIFETAWCGVPIIVEEMSKQFPEIEIVYEFADEDIGYNTGYYKLKNGIIEELIFKGGSKESYDLAFKLRPERKNYYKLVNNNYICVDV